MSDFGELKTVTGRKVHHCGACWGRIPKGESHHHFKGIWEGEWQDWRMHNECYEAYCADEYEEFVPGDYPVPDRIVKLYQSTEVSHVAD